MFIAPGTVVLTVLFGCTTLVRGVGSTAPTGAVQLRPDTPVVVKKIMPADCRLVRGFTHAPVDGRIDTRYPTGSVGEWQGANGIPAVNYRVFNGNNGLHITLAEDTFDALQIRGGWQGKIYTDYDGLMPPAPDLAPLCTVRTQTDVFRQLFSPAIRSRRLSFFYVGEDTKPLADVTVLRVTPRTDADAAGDNVTFGAGGPTAPDGVIRRALGSRFEGATSVRLLVEGQNETVSLTDKRYLHFVTAPQDRSQGITAVAFDLDIARVEPGTMLTIRVQDVLDPRRECMGVDFELSGPGRYSFTLDTPDQVFLPARESWPRTPRLSGPIVPSPVLWVSMCSSPSLDVADLALTLERVPRAEAMREAGAWRKFLLRGLFSAMSEPRPWMNLKDIDPAPGKAPDELVLGDDDNAPEDQGMIRQQINESKAIARYRTSLVELLETAEVARILLPDDDIARQYHDWLYQNVDRRKPMPPPVLPEVPGAPSWAVSIRQTWRALHGLAQWWLDNRLVANGELGGGINDDTDMFQVWQCLPMIESTPLGTRLKDVAARLADLAMEWKLEDGINKHTMDALHAYEEGVNQLALCAWWFYGDPVHFERAMLSARSVGKLMVETKDDRVHFGAGNVGIEQARHGYEKLGPSPGNANWAPVRLLLHPLYVVAWYNRNPAVLRQFGRWADTWAGYQKPNQWVGQVDIQTGKPLVVSTKLPTGTAVGPVNEWLALYQVTGDPKWCEPMKRTIDAGGYWGVAVQYGRLPQMLVRWEEPYQTLMQKRYTKAGSGYAGFFLSKDRACLDSWLADSASWYGRFPYMFTSAEQKTDRVLTYKATTAIACYLGDAPNRNRWLNFNAVSYEGLRGEDYAALVWDAGPDRLRVAIYNFRDKPLRGLLRVWRLDHGRYLVCTGSDTNDDGAIDEVVDGQSLELQRYSAIALTLAPHQVTVVQVKQERPLDDILDRADLALSPLDTRLAAAGPLEVKLHNIGAQPARDVRVIVQRHNRTIADRTVPVIEAPLDLEPRIVVLQFKDARPGDVVVVDPDNAIPEIAEHNNRLVLIAPEQP